MEEFIENFNKFREWLYDKADNSESYEKVLEKFEEFKLNDAF